MACAESEDKDQSAYQCCIDSLEILLNLNMI